eukprot:s1673_g1.t1
MRCVAGPAQAAELKDLSYFSYTLARLCRQEVRLDRQQCDFDEAAGQMIINSDITRVVPIATLFAQYSLCADEAARSKLVDGAMKAFVEGAADVPSSIAETGDRLLPQLWNKQKIAARQMTLPAGFELPHCGLRGELPLDGELELHRSTRKSFGELAGENEEGAISRQALGASSYWMWRVVPLAHVIFNGGPAVEGLSVESQGWKDRFDAVRIAVFPKLVATRKRPDGVAEQGGSDGLYNRAMNT